MTTTTTAAADAAFIDNNPQAGQGRPLPKKESDLFKNVVKFYESKQYKKGIKAADAILKRYPNHGETLCMKGLIVNAMANAAVVFFAQQGGGGGGDGDGAGAGVDKKKEAVELVKKGLMMDMRSHVCWHVYGLLHRSSQNYTEAIKAYKQALRIDSSNLQILRDLGLLQIQMRDLHGFRDTRLKILTLRPNSKVHWLTYAVAVHVTGDANGAVGVLDSYMDTLDKDCVEFQRNFEASELAMYKNWVLAESTTTTTIPPTGDAAAASVAGQEDNEPNDGLGGIRKALCHLDEIDHIVVDRTGFLMTKLSYQLQLGQFDGAKETVSSLFERGLTEDYRVHGAYMCALLKCDTATCREVEKLKGMSTLATLRPLSEDERAILLSAYYGASGGGGGEEDDGFAKASANGKDGTINGDSTTTMSGLASTFPRSMAIKRIYLTLLSPGCNQFKWAIDQYCRRQIIKGVPSLGSDLSSLYLVEEKLQAGTSYEFTRYRLAKDPIDIKAHAVYSVLVELVDAYIVSLESDGTFPDDTTKHPPSALVWAWYLRSVLYEQAAEYGPAISLINKCIDHTPTAVDFYELKSRVLESGGDIQLAADVVNAGRDLDHQDRYINNLATKTLLRAGREDEATKCIALFARHEAPVEQNLYDMQCTWFELELADCLRRRGALGRSLRKYMAVIKHYEVFHEDQFDFHMYCIRKVTLRSYCKLLKFEDELWGLPIYGRAAEEIIRIHLSLIANDANAKTGDEPDYSGMTPAERKKAKNIARKKKKALTDGGSGSGGGSDTTSKNMNAKNGAKTKSKPHAIDEDPEGNELLSLDHLDEAKKFAAVLVRHAPRRISAWALQFDVSIRRGKMLLALQALFKMKSIDSDDHGLFSRIVEFSQYMSLRTSQSNSAADHVLSSEFPKLMNNETLAGFVKMAMEAVKADSRSSLPMRIAVARAMLAANLGCSTEAASLILSSKLNVRGVTVESCREALAFMDALGPDGNDSKNQMMMLITTKFPFAKDFGK